MMSPMHGDASQPRDHQHTALRDRPHIFKHNTHGSFTSQQLRQTEPPTGSMFSEALSSESLASGTCAAAPRTCFPQGGRLERNPPLASGEARHCQPSRRSCALLALWQGRPLPLDGGGAYSHAGYALDSFHCLGGTPPSGTPPPRDAPANLPPLPPQGGSGPMGRPAPGPRPSPASETRTRATRETG